MKGIQNPVTYDDKLPTNVRLEPVLKTLLIDEASKANKTMSDVLNEILKAHYFRVTDNKK